MPMRIDICQCAINERVPHFATWNKKNLRVRATSPISQNIPQVCRPLDIETLAASRALKFAAELGFNKVVLEGDCEVLIKALKGGDQFLSTVGLVMNDIHYDANIFYQLRYSHVRRVGNKIAYSLANRALEITDFVI